MGPFSMLLLVVVSGASILESLRYVCSLSKDIYISVVSYNISVFCHCHILSRNGHFGDDGR